MKIENIMANKERKRFSKGLLAAILFALPLACHEGGCATYKSPIDQGIGKYETKKVEYRV